MNKVIMIGNLTHEPELKTTPSGVSVCKMSIAVKRSFANADGERETDFFNVVAWRNLAENCAKYLTKGSKAAVVGELQTRSYEDKNGNTRYITEVNASEVEFLSQKVVEPATGQESPQTAMKNKLEGIKPADNDDLPF